MNRILILFFLAILGCMSCKNSEKDVDHLQIAKQYYKILDTSDDASIAGLLIDSLLTIESEYDYEQTFSLNEYIDWIKWDASFDPSYRILHIEQENGMVKAKISKIDRRILFLHEEPIVTNQIIRFDKDKIISIETTKYEVFNDSVFSQNRSKLLNWIDENHPDLNGFIYDQTEAGAVKYLRALKLYRNHIELQGQ
ncbi:MAG: hypothetical protein AB3N14_13140 [Flavobacteriaceae bacterium]